MMDMTNRLLVLLLSLASFISAPYRPCDWPGPPCGLPEMVACLSVGGPDKYHPTAEVKPCDYNWDGYYDLLDVQALQNCWPEGE